MDNNTLVKIITYIGIISPHELQRHLQECAQENLGQYFLTKKILSPQELEFVYETSRQPQAQKPHIGHFFVQRKIAEGGMGVIYKAYDLRAKRIVALKVLKQVQNSVARFQREMQVLSQIHHPNIVTLYGIHCINNITFYSMEYIDGQTLEQVSDLSFYKIAQIMMQVASAVHFVHRLGVIHRDLKPSNIMISKDMTPKVMDFGLAKEQSVSSELTKSGVFIGTIYYASPEQIKGERLGIRTDVYSLGATLYTLLAKRTPFVADSIHKLGRQIIEEPCIALHKINKKTPRALSMICGKALEKNQLKRYRSCVALADDLQRFIRKRPVKAGENYLSYVLWNSLRKMAKPIIKISLFSMAVILAFFVIESWQSYTEEKRRENTRKEYNKLMRETVTAEQINLEKLSFDISPQVEFTMNNMIFQCVKARNLLQQLASDPKVQIDSHQQLYIIEKRISLLALAVNNFLLSRTSLLRCQNLDNTKDLASYFEKLDQRRIQFATYPQKKLAAILKILQQEPELAEEELRLYSSEIARMSDDVDVKIVALLHSKEPILRQFAAEVLGKAQTPRKKVQDKDHCEWLLWLLEKEQNSEVIMSLVWALGRLQDIRAWKPVDKKLHKYKFRGLQVHLRLPIMWLAQKRKVLEDNFKNPEQYLRAAYFFSSFRRDHNKAISICEKYLQLKNLTPQQKLRGQEYMGYIYLQIEENEKAIELLESLIAPHERLMKKSKKGDRKWINGLARVYVNIGSALIALYEKKPQMEYMTKAIACFKKYIELAPGWPGAERNLADAHKLLKQYDKALEYSALALENSKGNDIEAYYSYLQRSVIYTEMSQYKKALANVNLALKKSPKSADAFIQRATLYQKMNNYLQAYNDCSQALRLEPQHHKAKELRTLLDFELSKEKRK
ncbi:serine/threonine-protein kinase [Candidatus Uabimicrobium amorphum]|uniref:Protein kinase n=1 Tax=Uabimicrobium amorphum TaxID=2596890 RepID=A0A5S9IIB9_UABAM|nr:serine/threonine-protein kinase [Candidatus Uabimicrobium amorphum]BBM82090.1 protein kinase [Candidatus Uabimicrobium amorphum]